jgi:hypothetical protein
MDPVRNPYTPGAGTRPPVLAGREREIARFETLVQRLLAAKTDKGLMITGLRGVGKTVLLSTFSDIAESNQFYTAHTEISEGVDFPSVVARMARKLLLNISPIERMKDRAKRALRVLKAFVVKLPDGPELGFDIEAATGTADSGRLTEDLPELVGAVGEAAREAGRGAMLFFDEIHYVAKEPLAALIASAHRVGQQNLPLAVIGAGLPQLPGIAGTAKSYAERLFDFPWIGRLDFDDASAALTEPARKLDVEYEPAAVDRIIDLSEGYPYFLQEYGKHIWNQADVSPITLRNVLEAEPVVELQLDESFFRVRIWKTTQAERRYLMAMAALGPGQHRSSEIADFLGMKPTSVAPTRANLIHKGLIYSPEYGFTAFSVPKFGDYMLRAYGESAE